MDNIFKSILEIKITLFIWILLISFSSLCSDVMGFDSIDKVDNNFGITKFSFSKNNNKTLSNDLNLFIEDGYIFGTVPVENDITSLKATFEYIGDSIDVDGVVQVSEK